MTVAARLLRREPLFESWWSAVPEDLGRTKARATAFAAAWRRWLGPCELRFTQRSDAGREAAAAAIAQAPGYETSTRRIWV